MHSAKRGRPAREPAEASTHGDDLLNVAAESDRVQVWRASSVGGPWNYAGSYELAVVRPTGLIEFLRQHGGGGKYKARLRHPDGTYGTSTTVTIEGPPRPWADPDGASSATSAPAAPAPSPGALGVFEKFLGPFAAAAGTAIATLLAKKLLEDPKADPIVLELLKRSGGVDPLELQNAMAAAEARGEARGRELGQLKAEKNAPASETGGALGALERGIPAVLEVVNRHLDIEERKVTPRALPAAAPGATTTTPAAPGDPLEALLLSVPIVARKFLLTAAENDEPAEVYASMVAGKLDDVTAARLPALLERADFGDVMVRVWPAFADFRPWVDSFVEALRAQNVEEGDDAAAAADDTSSSSEAAPS